MRHGGADAVGVGHVQADDVGVAALAFNLGAQGLQALDAVLKELDAQNFGAAAENAREVAKACRSCHDTYKPDKARF